MDKHYFVQSIIDAAKTYWKGPCFIESHPEKPGAPFSGALKIFRREFVYIIEKKKLDQYNITLLLDKVRRGRSRDDRDILVFCTYVDPSVYNVLEMYRVNFMDTAGNYRIFAEEDGTLLFHVSHEGEEEPRLKEPSYPLFGETGLKLIFFILQHPDNVSLPYRTLRDATGVSLGTIKNIITEMKARNLLWEKGRKRILTDAKKLLRLWVHNYEKVLKPKLLMREFNFADEGARIGWDRVALPEGTYWGGECAAALSYPGLTPSTYQLYSEVPMPDISHLRVIVRESGELKVYKKFWRGDDLPSLLLYADLVHNRDKHFSRTAQTILDEELPHLAMD